MTGGSRFQTLEISSETRFKFILDFEDILVLNRHLHIFFMTSVYVLHTLSNYYSFKKVINFRPRGYHQSSSQHLCVDMNIDYMFIFFINFLSNFSKKLRICVIPGIDYPSHIFAQPLWNFEFSMLFNFVLI